MKKSLLALIVAPLFIHSANAHPDQYINTYTSVRSNHLDDNTLFTFSDNKNDNDRAAGISELDHVANGIKQYLLENYEYIDDVKKETDNQAAQLHDKIDHVHHISIGTNKLVDTFINDVTTKVVPEKIDKALPDAVKNQLLPLEKRTESLEIKASVIDAELNSVTQIMAKNKAVIDNIPDLIKKGIDEGSKGYHEYVQSETILKDEVDTLKTQVQSADQRTEELDYFVSENEKAIFTTWSKVKSQGKDIEENKKLLASAGMVTSAIEDATLALEADVAKMDTRISNASKKAGTATNIANENTRHIAQHAVKIDKNTLDVLKNRQDLRSLEKDLRETNERLDNGLAASAALNGLFQPYGVGKLNITAAVGGYQSTQAVAVGTGYRFNENIAVKTGVAYTGSNDVMYNMAMNLEW